MNQVIKELLNFTTVDSRDVIINNKYECEFANVAKQIPIIPGPPGIFSEKVRDADCPRLSQYANVIVKDLTTTMCYVGCLFVNEDVDINKKSMSLAIKELADENWTTIISVTSCVIK